MQSGDSTPKPQTAPVLQPPRPPGPPTRTAIGLAPELPEPDDPRSGSSRVQATRLSAACPEPGRTLLATLDKALAILAAVVALGAAIAVWISLMVSAH